MSCVCVCVSLGAGEEQRGIFLFNLPSQGWWLEPAHPLSQSRDSHLGHGIIWASTWPRKTIRRGWKGNKDRMSLLPGVVGRGCCVQEGANLLLFLPGCPVLCDTHLSPSARAILGVSQALGWDRWATAPTAWARDAPALLPWKWLRHRISSWIILGRFASSYMPKLGRVFIIYYGFYFIF